MCNKPQRELGQPSQKILESSLFVGWNRLGDCHLQENAMGITFLRGDGQSFQGGSPVSLLPPGFEKAVGRLHLLEW